MLEENIEMGHAVNKISMFLNNIDKNTLTLFLKEGQENNLIRYLKQMDIPVDIIRKEHVSNDILKVIIKKRN